MMRRRNLYAVCILVALIILIGALWVYNARLDYERETTLRILGLSSLPNIVRIVEFEEEKSFETEIRVRLKIVGKDFTDALSGRAWVKADLSQDASTKIPPVETYTYTFGTTGDHRAEITFTTKNDQTICDIFYRVAENDY